MDDILERIDAVRAAIVWHGASGCVLDMKLGSVLSGHTAYLHVTDECLDRIAAEIGEEALYQESYAGYVRARLIIDGIEWVALKEAEQAAG